MGLEEMRAAMRQAGLLGAGLNEPPGPQPQRGPAFVAPLPLTRPMGPPVRLSDLKAAMQLAGLSGAG
jgi:hypothetical protein